MSIEAILKEDCSNQSECPFMVPGGFAFQIAAKSTAVSENSLAAGPRTQPAGVREGSPGTRVTLQLKL